ncbi:MAG: hypothetical protein LBU44_09965 [Mediterranea sp.]|jgi:transposase|nr:hypothetical protein [Mediterranea sp.]
MKKSKKSKPAVVAGSSKAKGNELLAELEYLRAENAYLKKMAALVEERIIRESGKDAKPSKD